MTKKTKKQTKEEEANALRLLCQALSIGMPSKGQDQMKELMDELIEEIPKD